MKHDTHCGCGCGGDHDHAEEQGTKIPATVAEVSDNQKEFLHQLHHHHYLPVARFTLTDSREPSFVSTALAPVFLRAAADDMATVKEAGAFLQKLEDMALITLDYDIPLNGYGYEEHRGSALYTYFRKTVAEGAGKPGFLGDTPLLELGSMALTEAGEAIAAAHCGHAQHHE